MSQSNEMRELIPIPMATVSAAATAYRSRSESMPANIARPVRRARLAFDRGRQCPLNRPATGQPAAYQVLRESEVIGPLADCQTQSAKFNNTIRTPVVLLRFSGCPAAVARFVIARIIEPLDRMAVRARPHVSEEHHRIVPWGINGNSARSIVRVFRMLRVIAAPHHGLPGLVGAGFGQRVRGSRETRHPCFLLLQTAAGFALAVLKLVTPGNQFAPAFASAMPPPAALLRPARRLSYHRQSSEDFTNEIGHICNIADVPIMARI